MRFKDDNGNNFPNWTFKKLGEIGEVISGLTYSPNDIDESGILVLRSSNVKNRNLAFDDNVYVKTENYNPVKENDILICVRNGSKNLIGKNALINKESEGLAFGAFMSVYRSSFNQFVFQWFDTKQYKEIVKRNLGATINSINGSDLKKFKIPFPPIEEQQKISSFLSLLDEKIISSMKTIEELNAFKKGVAKKIFSKQLRFKDDNGNDFPEWESKEVGEIFKITRGNVLSMNLVSNDCNEETPYPVYSSQTKNKGLAGYYKFFLFENAITWTTDGANAGDVNYRSGKFYCTNVCGVLISNEGYANICISELINSVSKNYVSYVGNPKLMNGVMREITIPFPSIKEQQKIANFLSSIDSKIDIENQILQKLEEQKKYFLANLFI